MTIATTACVPAKRWQWTQLVASENGPDHNQTRLVLLTLALHMNEHGANCWPSQDTIAIRAALNVRVVKRHLKRAEESGWVSRRFERRPGRAWRQTIYMPTVPAALQHLLQSTRGAAPQRDGDHQSPSGQDARNWTPQEQGDYESPRRNDKVTGTFRRGDREARGGDRECTEVVTPSPTNLKSNNPCNGSSECDESTLLRSTPSAGTDLAAAPGSARRVRPGPRTLTPEEKISQATKAKSAGMPDEVIRASYGVDPSKLPIGALG